MLWVEFLEVFMSFNGISDLRPKRESIKRQFFSADGFDWNEYESSLDGLSDRALDKEIADPGSVSALQALAAQSISKTSDGYIRFVPRDKL